MRGPIRCGRANPAARAASAITHPDHDPMPRAGCLQVWVHHRARQHEVAALRRNVVAIVDDLRGQLVNIAPCFCRDRQARFRQSARRRVLGSRRCVVHRMLRGRVSGLRGTSLGIHHSRVSYIVKRDMFNSKGLQHDVYASFPSRIRSSQRALFGCFRVAARARKGKRLRVIAARAASYAKLCSI